LLLFEVLVFHPVVEFISTLFGLFLFVVVVVGGGGVVIFVIIVGVTVIMLFVGIGFVFVGFVGCGIVFVWRVMRNAYVIVVINKTSYCYVCYCIL